MISSCNIGQAATGSRHSSSYIYKKDLFTYCKSYINQTGTTFSVTELSRAREMHASTSPEISEVM